MKTLAGGSSSRATRTSPLATGWRSSREASRKSGLWKASTTVPAEATGTLSSPSVTTPVSRPSRNTRAPGGCERTRSLAAAAADGGPPREISRTPAARATRIAAPATTSSERPEGPGARVVGKAGRGMETGVEKGAGPAATSTVGGTTPPTVAPSAVSGLRRVGAAW